MEVVWFFSKSRNYFMKSKTQALICSFYLSLTPELRGYLRPKLKRHKVFVHVEPLSQKNAHSETEVMAVFVDSKVDKKVIDAHPKLRLIIAMSAGYDHIDLAYAKKKKIVVCNIPSYGENTVAEHTLALLLSLSRKLFASVKRVKEGEFDYHGLRGFDVRGKTVGVIGTGRIGAYFIQLLQGFGVKILAYDPYPNNELQKNHSVEYVSLKKLLQESDIISLHTPLLDSTHHIIDKKAVKLMKTGVYILNTARGALIDPEALMWGLEEGVIAGAGLDVLEGEEDIKNPELVLHQSCGVSSERICLINNLLIDHPRVIVTPHNAFNSNEAVKRIIDTTIVAVKDFADKKEIRGRVV